MYKNFCITLIILCFCLFAAFDFKTKSKVKVLNIINAVKVQADLNHNGIIDINETLCIPNTDALSANLNLNQKELQNKLDLNFEDSIKYGYLSDIFAENQLADKFVKIKYTGQKTPECTFADIFVNNESYGNKLAVSGFGIINGQRNQNFDSKLQQAKKLNLVILNHRSNKYHKLNCEYGLVARDSVIVPLIQVKDSSLPCKYCHIKKSYSTDKPIIYPLIISNGSMKMFLTDLTITLKPDSNCNSLICKEIINNINNSKQSIDIALYGWDNVPAVYNALLNAKNRGIKIRGVYDISNNNYYPETQNIIKIFDSKQGDDKSHLMHNKFIIFDNQIVITGSMNFSKTGLSGFNSNCIFSINSNEIAKIYTDEFNQMISGKFKQHKSRLKTQIVSLNSTKITPLFSPQDKIVTNQILSLIKNAKNYIYIPAFIITHEKLAEELISAKQRGVDVKIILDASTSLSAKNKLLKLRNAQIPVKIENYAGKIHSKSIIIDDKYIIAGSMNFTNSGENYNDENSLIIEDKRLTAYYKGFFEYLWNKIPDKYLNFNPKAESKDSIGSCFDGIDNDYDGKIDSKDEACQ